MALIRELFLRDDVCVEWKHQGECVEHLRGTHGSPCCRKMRKVSLLQVPEIQKCSTPALLPNASYSPFPLLSLSLCRTPLTLCYLKNSLWNWTLIPPLPGFPLGSKQARVIFPCTGRLNLAQASMMITREGVYTELLSVCLSCAQHVKDDLATLGSSFSSYYTFSPGNLIETHGYWSPANLY